jgi:transmembrane sensor
MRVSVWRSREVAAAFAELSRRRSQQLSMRSRWRWVSGSVAAVAASVLLTLGLLGKFEPPVSQLRHTSAEALSERVELGESTEVRFGHGTELEVVERTGTQVTVRVDKGAARFQVRHDPKRLFRVEAGDVLVEDLGTVFSVERRGSVVDVGVSEGQVAVSFTAGNARRRVTLAAGQSGSYSVTGSSVPLAPPEPAPAASGGPGAVVEDPDKPAEQVPAPGAAPSSERGLTASADWRSTARAGDYRSAHPELASRHFEDVKNTPADLLLASDVARWARHPADSVQMLRRLLSNHPRDDRAPSAAFTLGWVLMSDLGRHREAAEAFERALALAPNGNLAQDARARAVEAWHRAGDEARARRQLDLYRERYPKGRHLERLERLVGSP